MKSSNLIFEDKVGQALSQALYNILTHPKRQVTENRKEKIRKLQDQSRRSNIQIIGIPGKWPEEKEGKK